MPRCVVLRWMVMLLGRQVAAVGVVVVLPRKQAVITRVAGDDTGRR